MQRWIRAMFVVMMMAVIAVPASAPVAAQETDPDDISVPRSTDVWCWCTQFVQQARGLSPHYGDAHTWNDGYLQSQGYVQRAGAPVRGDLVVFEIRPSMPYGHVAIYKTTLNGAWMLLGANQSNAGWISRAGCYNVNKIAFAPQPASVASFWYKP